MSNSPLVAYTKISPNKSSGRTHTIDTITPHCVVGQCSVETLGEVFAPESRQASSNYGIGVDGRVGMYVEEKDRSWCTSNRANDQRAVTIECASDTTEPYAFKDVVYKSLIELCADICKRNGKTKLIWLGDKDKTLNYNPKSNEMLLTVHRWFANKSCPGNWLYSRMDDLASKVNAIIGDKQSKQEETPEQNETKKLYRVQVGSFNDYANAVAMKDKLKAAGFDSFVTSTIITSTTNNSSSKKTFKVGDKVTLAAGAKYSDGRDIPSFIKSKTLFVRQIYTNGNIVISTLATGAVTGVVEPKYLVKK